MIALDQARQHLETLGLKQALEILDNTLDAAASRQLPYPEMLAELLGDSVIASAVLDRLLHHSHVLNIRGESYRLREKRQAGLFPSQQHLGTGLAEASDNYRD